jgi:hypothetical protein
MTLTVGINNTLFYISKSKHRFQCPLRSPPSAPLNHAKGALPKCHVQSRTRLDLSPATNRQYSDAVTVLWGCRRDV